MTATTMETERNLSSFHQRENDKEKVATPPVSAAAIASFKESVVDNKFDEAICDAIYCTPQWWHGRRALYEKRMDARKTVDEYVAENADVSAQEAMTALPGSMTLDEVRSRIHDINPKLPLNTTAQLAAGMAAVADHEEKSARRARTAKQRAYQAKVAAERFLFTSCAERDPDPAIAAIQRNQAAVQSRIAEQQKALEMGRLVEEQRKITEKIGSGELLPSPEMVKEWGDAAARHYYLNAKEQLAQFLRCAARRPEIEREIQRCQTEIVKLQAELQAANEARRIRRCDPENMAWIEQ